MKHIIASMFVMAAAFAPAAVAQKWEVGAGVGGGFYTSQTFKGASASADAGLSNALAVSAWLGNDSGRVLGGELRYDYERANLKLSSGGANVAFGAQTHAFHYDFLFRFAPAESSIVPFVAAGGGVKVYSGTGTESAFQPLSDIGVLTKTSETKPLLSVGGGVKFHIAPAIQLRIEAHDFLTPFPKNVITPVQSSKGAGWLQDFVVMAGVSYVF